jgi:3-oxoacyl-[acyl-carrier-protein] synthase-3
MRIVRYERVSIAAVGYELPPRILTSAAIEDRLEPIYRRIGLHPGRLELMTGIRERRYWPDEVKPSEVAARAGADALQKSAVDKRAIGCIIHASVCRDFIEPATANLVHERLGLPAGAHVFDVSNACLGVLNAMLIVANMIELGQIEAGLVVAGEIGKPLVDSTIARLLSASNSISRKSIKESIASLTIGSGAAAVVLVRSDLAARGHRILGASVRAATEHNRLCRGSTQSEMSTDAEALLEAGIALARQNWSVFLEELSWTQASPSAVITHQVGRAHEKALFDALHLPEEKGHRTYDRLGNVGSAALPLTLALAEEAGLVARDRDVALLGIGSGLSSIMMGVRW